MSSKHYKPPLPTFVGQLKISLSHTRYSLNLINYEDQPGRPDFGVSVVQGFLLSFKDKKPTSTKNQNVGRVSLYYTVCLQLALSLDKLNNISGIETRARAQTHKHTHTGRTKARKRYASKSGRYTLIRAQFTFASLGAAAYRATRMFVQICVCSSHCSDLVDTRCGKIRLARKNPTRVSRQRAIMVHLDSPRSLIAYVETSKRRAWLRHRSHARGSASRLFVSL